MRRCVILATVLFVVAASAQETTAPKRPTVLVCNFETAGGAASYFSETTAKMMMAALTYVGEYRVVSEEKQAKLMESIGKDPGEKITTSEAVEAAGKAGAKVVLTGKVTREGDYYTVSVSYVDADTGSVKETKSAKSKYSRNISKSIDELVGLTE